MRKIGITETVLRDANQSLIATRMPFSDFENILSTMDKAGYNSLECWGGATFDSCLRYLNEDPWERLANIRKAVPNTKLQMLLRGQNILGYRPYADDIVRKFCEYSVKTGIDIIRIFDALNDITNMRVALEESKKHGAYVQAAFCFTLSPVHTLEKFASMAKELEGMGADAICIKDMSGIMGPQECYDLVKAIKESVDLPVVIHTHSTTGLGPMTLLKGVEAGADVIDTAISVMSGGTSQPATESMAYALRQLGYQIDLDDAVVRQINEHFRPVKQAAIESGLLDPYVMGTETDALVYQIPGGMLSNLIAQMKAQNAIDRLPEVLAETPKVRADLGYPPLVTPMSQMTGAQAVNNVLAGQRYVAVSKEIRAYLNGEYGRTPGPISEELKEKVLRGKEPMQGRYADTIPPQFDTLKAELGALAQRDTDVLSYAAFPAQAKAFLEGRAAAQAAAAQAPAAQAAAPAAAQAAAPAAPAAPVAAAEGYPSPLPGTVVRVDIAPGQAVKAGQTLLVLEAMKMENDIVSPRDAVVESVSVTAGKTVAAGEILFTLR
jgi:oxaloacetate decarboxylase alpha subunit